MSKVIIIDKYTGYIQECYSDDSVVSYLWGRDCRRDMLVFVKEGNTLVLSELGTADLGRIRVLLDYWFKS